MPTKNKNSANYAEKVKYLRSIGEAPKVDLRSVSKLSAQKKALISRAFAKFDSKYEFWSRNSRVKGALEFVETSNKALLKMAGEVWSESNIVKGKGFFVPKGLYDVKSGKTKKAYVSKVKDKNGNVTEVLKRRVGQRLETYIPTPNDPKKWNDKAIKSLVEKANSLKQTGLALRVGFVISESISKRVYSLDDLLKKLNYYLSSLKSGSLVMPALIVTDYYLSAPQASKKYLRKKAK